MKEMYSHKVLTSFKLWFDYTLLSKADAYKNVPTGYLYKTPDDGLYQGYTAWSSPFRQWVSDSSISGALIPNGIRVSGVPIANPIVPPNYSYDYENGRLITTEDLPTNVPISTQYAVKDFNVYTIPEEHQQLIFEGTFLFNPRYSLVSETKGVTPYDYVAPACFIVNSSSENKPFAFGGEQDTKSKFRVIVVAEDDFKLDGVLSLFRDLTESVFSLVNLSDDPFNELGSLKSPTYTYPLLAEARKGRYVFIEKVTTAKLKGSRINSPQLKFGIIDFYLSEPRVPKQDL